MRITHRHTMAAAVMLGIFGVAGAATKTDTFQVTVNVPQNCLVTATDLDFGTYTPGGGDVTNTSTISVSCTDGRADDVNLNGGLGGSDSPRTMIGALGVSIAAFIRKRPSRDTAYCGLLPITLPPVARYVSNSATGACSVGPPPEKATFTAIILPSGAM